MNHGVYCSVLSVKTLCQSPTGLAVTTAPRSISSSDLAQSGCPTALLHATLHARPGQQINVTMLDFLWGSSPAGAACVPYGHMTDSQTGRRVSVCGGQQRWTNLMVSISSSIQLDLQPIGPNIRYMLHFQGYNIFP